MADKDTLVHVEIFGQDYAVRGGDDPAYVERLAAFVDDRMKEISQTSGAVDTLRIAVLAALNVADECFLTGTAAEVVPVVKVDDRVIGTGTPGPVPRG